MLHLLATEATSGVAHGIESGWLTRNVWLIPLLPFAKLGRPIPKMRELFARLARLEGSLVARLADTAGVVRNETIQFITDAWLLERKAQFARIRHRFILVPGDNEWRDCRQPLERQRVLQHRRKHLGHVSAIEPGAPRQHLVEDDAERPDVGAAIDRLALGLLRGHVGGSPEDDAGVAGRQ